MTFSPNDAPLAEVTRGADVESLHEGAAVVVDADGQVVFSAGDVAQPVYTRSSIKALLALPLVETGAAERLGLSAEELALACASHTGEVAHTETAARMLARVGRDVGCLECGAHWPTSERAARGLAAIGQEPSALHNNCSGKHAGLVCLACDNGFDVAGYISADHPAMRIATQAVAEMTGAAHDDANRGVDGCSIPTYAIPLTALAHGFARFGTGKGLSADRARACVTLRQAVAEAPFMVAGTGRFDTQVMETLGTQVFCKMGAEGIMIAALPEVGLGIAIKCRDGAIRAAYAAAAALMVRFGGDAIAADPVVRSYLVQEMRNWNGLRVGEIRAHAGLTG